MHFLLIAERELRAGARRKGTHRLRWITGAVFFGLLVWLMWAFSGFRTPQIFQRFAEIVFFYCLFVGTARTADCLSSEKREGTMGLLFLTNLNGPEIVGGKLCSNALAVVYGLFAIFPLLALQMLIGGITLGQFWRTVLALVNVIFFSVSTGFLASSICLRQFTAIAMATGLALFFSVVLMGLAAAASALPKTPVSTAWVDGLTTFSPLYTLISADGGRVFGRNHYWWSVAGVAGHSSIFLMVATWQVSRSWRDRAAERRGWGRFKGLESWQQRSQEKRSALRRRLLRINPFYWLGGRSRVSAPVFMVLSIVIVAIASGVAAPFFGRVIRAGTLSPVLGHLLAWVWAGGLIHALVLYYAGMVSSRRLAEDKQTGALELVLSTPTSERSISRGLWLAYGRKMLFPALVAILVHLFFIWQGATLALLDTDSFKLPAGTSTGELLWHALLDRPFGRFRIEWGFVLALRILLLSLVLFILIWLTLGWLGRWLGLRLKHPGFAPMISLALVLVPPVLLFTLACYCADKFHLDRLPERKAIPIMMWVAFGLQAGHCALMSLWAAGRLRRDFRAVVTSRFQPPPTQAWWRPTRRQVFRLGLGGVATVVALALIVLSFFGYQNWRSRRAWVAFQNQLQQRKESLDLSALLPPPVPDSQNFALTPEFRNWVNLAGRGASTNRLLNNLRQFDVSTASPGVKPAGIEWVTSTFAPLNSYVTWISPGVALGVQATREDYANAVLAGLKPQAETLRALALRARLPYLQISTNRSARTVLHPARDEFAALERLHMLFQVRACALLAAGRKAEAAEDLLTGLHLVRLARQMPDAWATVRAQTLLARSLQPLWEGLVEQRWSEADLAAFQGELSQINLLSDHTNALRRVVLAQIETWRAISEERGALATYGGGDAYLRQIQPSAWWLDNCMQIYQAGENALELVDASGGRVANNQRWGDLDGLQLDSEIMWLFQQPFWWGGASPRIVAFAQTAANQAILACALERFRLAEGTYPETLEQLLPKYLRATPNDIVRGRPLLYENTGDGRFVLRSVGPNEVDDRTKPASDDWLWTFPTNAPAAAASQPKKK